MTSDRDRLIELLEDTLKEWECDVQTKTLTQIADHLLANGVSILPLPIGSTVYEIRARGIKKKLGGIRKYDYGIVNDMYFKNAKEYNLEFYVQEKTFVKTDKIRWNKTIFATKEKAEEKLKELSNGTT